MKPSEALQSAISGEMRIFNGRNLSDEAGMCVQASLNLRAVVEIGSSPPFSPLCSHQQRELNTYRGGLGNAVVADDL